MKPSHNRAWLAALCLLIPVAAQALSTDRDQPINIQADRVNLQEKRGYSEYLGDVEMTQGSMVLKADRVTIYQRDGHLQKVQASGNPAHFSQLPDGGETRIQAQAHEIDYDAITGRLVLTGKARVVQGANTFAGARIDYDTRHATVSASKGGTGQGRVHATIQPPGESGDKPPGSTPATAPKSKGGTGKGAGQAPRQEQTP